MSDYQFRCLLVVVGLLLLPVLAILLLPEMSPVETATELRSERSKRMSDPFGYPDKFAKMFHEMRTVEGGQSYPINYQLEALRKARASLKRSGTSIPWVERGPGNAPGRSRSIVIDPADPSYNTWFVGSVSGGVWHTTDGGESWVSLTDHLPNIAVSCMEMAPSNHDILYFGTGEGFGNPDAAVGAGIFKSEDRGQTWMQLASTAKDSEFSYVNRLAIDPGDANTVLAATNTGIFRTDDGGMTWIEAYGSGYPIQDLQAHPDRFDVLFATEYANSVLRSTDGGRMWAPSLTSFANPAARMELGIAPTDPDIVYVAVDVIGGSKSDLYRTTDGGETWTYLVQPSASTVSWLDFQGWYDNSIAIHPFSPDTMWLGGVLLWNAHFTGVSGPDTTFATVNVDKPVDSLLFLIKFEGNLSSGKVQLGTEDPQVLDIVAEDMVSVEIRFGPGKSQKAHRFTVSENGGTNSDGGAGIAYAEYKYRDFVDVPFEAWDTDNNRQLVVSFRDQADDGTYGLIPHDPSGPRNEQSREYLFIHGYDYDGSEPNPNVGKDGGVVYKTLYLMWPVLDPFESWDPGNLPEGVLAITYGTTSTQFFEVELNANGRVVHVDHHGIELIPLDPATNLYKALLVNDGGVWVSENSGKDWSGIGSGLNTTQFYGVDKRPGEQQYLGGSQDRGTWLSRVDDVPGSDPNRDWSFILGSDGFESVWHSENDKMMLGSTPHTDIYRSIDGGVTWAFASNGLVDADLDSTSPFATPLGNHKDHPDVVYTIGRSGVWRSDDFASTWSLVPIPSEQWGFSFSGKVRVSLADPNVVWAGFRMDGKSAGARTKQAGRYTGLVHVSRDGGNSFDPVSATAFAPATGISGLATHPISESTAYVLFSAYSTPARPAPKILRTKDFGQTWEDLSGIVGTADGNSTNGFPNVDVYDLLVMPQKPTTLWAATNIGIFATYDDGGSWEYADNGLPAVSVWQLKIVDDQVVAATHGRGIWTVELEDVAVNIEDEVTDLPVAFELEPNYPNPFNASTTIRFSLPEPLRVELAVFDALGRQVTMLVDQEYAVGSHEVTWDAQQYASGVYFCRVKAGRQIRSQRMLLIK